jgi:hypothetical protein
MGEVEKLSKIKKVCMLGIVMGTLEWRALRRVQLRLT